MTGTSLGLIFTAALVWSCNSQSIPTNEQTLTSEFAMENKEIITLGSGCFWCTEAVFEQLNGVHSAVSGYMGGKTKNPSYKEICTGTTGHAEVIQVTFDPNVISIAELLEVFFATHDPTTLNRQGADVGTQYRSAIFFHTPEQEKIALKAKEAANESGEWNAPIITEITAASTFYPAEDYHQSYFELNGNQPYCTMVIAPKMDKFKKRFAEKLK